MMKHRGFIKLVRTVQRKYSTKPKLKVRTNEAVLNDIENDRYKPKHHPGIIKPKTVTVPDEIVTAINKTIEDYPIKALVTESIPLVRHLKGRVAPMEREQFDETKQKVLQNVLAKEGNVQMADENDEQQFKQKVKDKVAAALRNKVYNWKPINYNAYNSLLYLIGRSASEYAVLVRIFSEINGRDQDFRPNSFFDFGSGSGTATWAANLYWKKHIFEYFNVDASSDMNDLAQIVLQGGRGTKQNTLKGVFYRQFLPSNNTTYDLVVSAYSLLELPSFESRMNTVLNLWNKTAKYLVIVENGTNGGFKVVNEARDFLLQITDEPNKGHVFSPCPHDTICPRFLTDDTPCNFEVSYFTLPVGANSEIRRELYSYVVLKKGARSPDDLQWPRIVRQRLARSKHSICRVCTAKGRLDELIFTAAKHGKTTYHCARATEWGDRLPVTIEEIT